MMDKHCKHGCEEDGLPVSEEKFASIQAQYEDMKQERDMFAEKLAEAEEALVAVRSLFRHEGIGLGALDGPCKHCLVERAVGDAMREGE